MLFCYVDESGDFTPLPNRTSPIQPVFVICGLVVWEPQITQITREFNALKRRYFPGRVPATMPPHSWMLEEIKGADLRRNLADPSRNVRRHTTGFIDRAIRILETYQAKLIGRVYIKGVAEPFDGKPVYTSSIQYIHRWFQHRLAAVAHRGLVICDSRTKVLNSGVSHSVFTQKHRAAGDSYPSICEMPLFGHSNNHACLQLADLVASAVLFPMACDVYCRGHLQSIHVRNGYGVLKQQFGARLEALQDRVLVGNSSRLEGGIAVSDRLARRNRDMMFS